MELLLLLALALVAVGAMFVHRHQRVVAWNRELNEAFGARARRELSQHRRL